MPSNHKGSVRIVLIGGIGGGGGGGMTPAKRRLVQQQLVLLLHAYKCNRRGKAAEASGEEYDCTLRHCKDMRGVIDHIAVCRDEIRCRKPHCLSSKQILKHWRTCENQLCLICKPLKMAERVPRHNPFPDCSSNGCA